MSSAVSYEVYSHKNGNWNIDSVYDDKAEAMYEAKQLLESRYSTGVKVIEESFDDETADTSSKIIFQQVKGNRTPPRTEIKKPKARARVGAKPGKGKKGTGKRKKKKKRTFTQTLILLVLSIGGIGAGLIGLLFFLVHLFEK